MDHAQPAWIVGCQAQGCDALGAQLTEAVARAVPIAVDRIRQIVQTLQKEPACESAR